MVSPRLGYGELVADQDVPEVTVNEMARFLEQGAGHFILLDRDLTAPPGSPAQGDAYIVATGGTGDWSGHDDEIAFFMGSAWEFITVIEGFTAWVSDENVLIVYNGAAWAIVGGSPPPVTIGVSFLPKPTNDECLLFYTFTEAVDFPANFTGSDGDPGVNATAPTVFTVYQNPTFTADVITGGTNIGTVTYSTSGTFTFATASGTPKSFAAGDSIGIAAPASADATATGTFTLKGARP